MLTSQLPLTFVPPDEATFANYHAGENELILQALQDLASAAHERYIYLWGKPGLGRTHLLQACCQQAAATGKTIQYLPLKEMHAYGPQILEGFEDFHLVCIDDLHLIAGDSDWEEAIFHFYNRLLSNQHQLLISADIAPSYLAIKLADLKSRLASGVVFQLHDLADEDKIKVLQIHARTRGLDMPTDVGQFLLKRHSRSILDLLTLLEQLDIASLAAQRRLTVPFVKSVLEN